MAKNKQVTFFGAVRDPQEAVQAEAAKVGAKIDKAFQKIARKMRDHAEKAKSKMDSTRKPEKRAVLLRRFELYSDAATYLESRNPKDDRE